MIPVDTLPIYVGVATACWLAYKGRGELYLRRWLPASFAVVLVGVGILPLFAKLGHDQYNLRELLRTDKPLAGVTLMAICLWIPLTAHAATAMWMSGKRMLAAVWIPVGLLVAWGLLRRSVTVESIHDILGSPTFLWPLDLEYITRFAAIYLPFGWLPLVLPSLAISSRRTMLVCAAVSAGLVAASPMIIANYSHADNVRELFRPNGGYWFGAMCLLAAWTAPLCGLVWRWFTAPVVLGLATVAAWWLFSLSVDVVSIHGLALAPAMFAATFLFYVFCSVPIAMVWTKARRRSA